MRPRRRESAQTLADYVFERLEQKDLAVGIERQDDDPARAARDEAAQLEQALFTLAGEEALWAKERSKP